MKKLFKFLRPTVAIVLIAAVFSACNLSGDSNLVTPEDGYAQGRIGMIFKTAFFNYSVTSVDYVDEYEGYTPSEGMQLIDSVITIRNTFSEELPMFNSDFQVQWHDLGESDDSYDYGVLIDGSETLAPEEYTLKRGETLVFHTLYEVPAEANEFSISFQEYFDDGTEGDVFFTFFEKD